MSQEYHQLATIARTLGWGLCAVPSRPWSKEYRLKGLDGETVNLPSLKAVRRELLEALARKRHLTIHRDPF